MSIPKKKIDKDKKSVSRLSKKLMKLHGKGSYEGDDPAGKPLHTISTGRYTAKPKIFKEGIPVKTARGKLHQGKEGEKVSEYSMIKTPFSKSEKKKSYTVKRKKPKTGLLEKQGL